MNVKKISIIVPIYNSEKLLGKCIESIINQTYKNLEIILVNDGSTDDSLKVCKAYSDRDDRIIIIDKENGGVSSARNSGLEIATGDLIGFVDSDDYIAVDMYEKLNKAIETNKADVAECGYHSLALETEELEKYPLKDEVSIGEYECSYSYLSGNNTTHFNCNKLYKKEMFKNIKYSSYSYSEDYVVNAKVFSKCKRKATISNCLYYYIKHTDSATHQMFSDKKLDIIQAGKEVYNIYKDKAKKLQILSVLYILNNIRKLYMDLMESETLEKEKYEKILINEYRNFYLLVSDQIYPMVKYKKTFIALWMFYKSPKLYCLIEKLRKII